MEERRAHRHGQAPKEHQEVSGGEGKQEDDIQSIMLLPFVKESEVDSRQDEYFLNCISSVNI
jgi:hypothetical protein